ncbi:MULTISPECIES: flagellin [unclassified Marinobacter]|uniref:flagellin n=1 Tax=unclassified Marinobacter TaxID=83889 RepID=UPI0012698584|nr:MULTISPECIES: flagellin [unclassified Marinobacter]QFS87695.1 Flagellin [Marinobacter sp. THAF197a]QFT51480.1 Flagellin [Marinobacter sp. THAF39]
MPQVINTNIASLNAQRNLNASQGDANVALQRLSSGLRINSAKDDAAGLAISERFQSQIAGLNQAQRNANDGISLAQTAEGAMDEITNNLQRIRELAVQSANATNSISDRQALNQEVQQRIEEINRIASQTSFNGLKVLDGTFGTQTFQVGANTGETIGVSGLDSRGSQLGATVGKTTNFSSQLVPFPPVETNALGLDYETNVSGDLIIDGTTVPIAYTGAVGNDIEDLAAEIQAQLTTPFPGLTVTGDTANDTLIFTNESGETVQVAIDLTDNDTPASTFAQSFESTGGSLADFFTANEEASIDFTVNGISFTADNVTSLNDVIGAINARSNETGVEANLDRTNQEIIFASQFGEDIAVQFTADLDGDGVDDIDVDETYAAATNTASLNTTDISTPDGADLAMITIDYAIDKINSFRAELGAVQNRFESTIANLSTTSENLSASNSRIRDADFAAETAELARTQVLQQAGLSVLAQANARPQQVLQLLQG